MKRISIEREFSLWKGGRPAHRHETDRFKEMLDSRADRIGISCVDKEVAHNSVEAKFSLIGRENIAEALRALRAGVEGIARPRGLDVCWTNQPVHDSEGHNEYFTTMAFAGVRRELVHANSLHIHFETDPEIAVHAYRQLNALAPSFMKISSMLGGGMGRLDITGAMAREFGELMLPQDFRGIADFQAYLGRMSASVGARMAREGTEGGARAMFPRMYPDGGPLLLTPDKVFSPARIRPDLRLPNGNISVEFRAIDGIRSLDDELGVAALASGVYDRVAAGMKARDSIAEARTFLLSLQASSCVSMHVESLPHMLVPAPA
ncbi:MAG: hypothetical protein AB1324_04100 [Candidatus Micrarchaeota archaeon]